MSNILLHQKKTVISRRQSIFATSNAIALLVAAAVLTPIVAFPLTPIPIFMTAFGTSMLIINFMLAFLLYGRAISEQNASMARLATAYFYVALIFLPLTAVFPGAVVANGFLGQAESAVWLWTFWHAGFALLVLRYVLTVHSTETKRFSVLREIVFALILAFVLAAISIAGLDLLPPLLANGQTFFTGIAELVPWAILAINLVAAVLLYRIPRQSPEQLWLAVAMVAASFDVWLTYQGENRYSLGWYVSKIGSVITTMVVLNSLFYDLILVYRRLSETNRFLQALALQDGLTGIANRRRLDEALKAEWKRALRARTPLALLMIDVDWFKKYNDHYGHLGGDDALRHVARVLKESLLRPSDLAARYGGEEFVLLLPETDCAGAVEIAERIRQNLNDQALSYEETPTGRLTVSIGVAAMIPANEAEPERLVKKADEALYRAKGGGRNQVQALEEVR